MLYIMFVTFSTSAACVRCYSICQCLLRTLNVRSTSFSSLSSVLINIFHLSSPGHVNDLTSKINSN